MNKILNLVYPDNSDITFTLTHYPDGQQDVAVNPKHVQRSFDGEYIDGLFYSVQIRSRFNNWSDLELITCATKALRRLGVENIHLYVPYILGERSDREFSKGGTSYLVDVIAPILNSLNYNTITCIDAHSDVASACINRLIVEDNKKLVYFALGDVYVKNTRAIYVSTEVKPRCLNNNGILISPDGGALKKIYKLAEAIKYEGPVICCSKFRDENGKLSKVIVPLSGEQNKDFFIIDDICDGGRTFINIATEIKRQEAEYARKPSKIYLIVTHGIFSAGFSDLEKYFDGIYCTNSIKDKDDILVNPGDPSCDRQARFINDKLKQLNVF
jgi:ribose-phosphate pyrophosphokinase